MDDLTDIKRMLNDLHAEAATARQHREDQRAAIERFWTKDWNELMSKITSIVVEQKHMDGRLRNLEVMLGSIPERVAKTEGKCEAVEKRLQTQAIALVVIGSAALGNLGAKVAAYF